MSASPTFSQKHYEYMQTALRNMWQVPPSEKQIAAEILCRVFEQDNPRFKRQIFLRQVNAEPM